MGLYWKLRKQAGSTNVNEILRYLSEILFFGSLISDELVVVDSRHVTYEEIKPLTSFKSTMVKDR